MTTQSDDRERLREETISELEALVRGSDFPWRRVGDMRGVFELGTRDLDGGCGDGLAFIYLDHDEEGPMLHGYDIHPVDADYGVSSVRFEYWGLAPAQLVRIAEREAVRSVCGTTCDRCPHGAGAGAAVRLCGHQGEQEVAERDTQPVAPLAFRALATRRAKAKQYPWVCFLPGISAREDTWVLATEGDVHVAWFVTLGPDGQVCVTEYEENRVNEGLDLRSSWRYADVDEAMTDAEREYDAAMGQAGR